MAYPTPVNGQITDLVTQVHKAGGDEALTAIAGLLQVVAHNLTASKGAATADQAKPSPAEAVSSAMKEAEHQLHGILTRLAGGG